MILINTREDNSCIQSYPHSLVENVWITWSFAASSDLSPKTKSYPQTYPGGFPHGFCNSYDKLSELSTYPQPLLLLLYLYLYRDPLVGDRKIGKKSEERTLVIGE